MTAVVVAGVVVVCIGSAFAFTRGLYMRRLREVIYWLRTRGETEGIVLAYNLGEDVRGLLAQLIAEGRVAHEERAGRHYYRLIS